jgi:uncharacterized protein
VTKQLTRLATAAILAVGLIAIPARAEKGQTTETGHLLVNDDAKLFTPGGIDAAKQVLAATQFDHGLSVRVSTFAEPPANKKAAAEAAKSDPAKWREFMKTWVKEQAANEGAKGIFVLIVRHPGGVGVIADAQTRERGFTDADEAKLVEILTKAFNESIGPDHNDKPDAAQIRDKGLKEAVEYVVNDLKDTVVPEGARKGATSPQRASGGGMGIMGWVCLGLVVVAAIWLVIALVRAFSGGGTGRGGGFFPALLGGLFGAAAGLWLYDHFFGGDGYSGGSNAYAGDDGDYDVGDTGAGDYGGESGAGGGFDDGGGDWGGGGDFGGDF